MTPAEIPPLEVKAAPAVAQVKLAHYFKRHQQAQLAVTRRQRKQTLLVAALTAALIPLWPFLGWWFQESSLTLVCIPTLFVSALAFGLAPKVDPAAAQKRPTTQRLLQQLLSDFAVSAPLTLAVDARDASEACEPERTTESPYSGRIKNYYRHPWLALKGQLADGSLLGLSLTERRKVKAGMTLWMNIQVRGKFRVPGDQPLPDLPHGTKAFCVCDVHARNEVLFWGVVDSEEQLETELRALAQLWHAARPA
ncbi:MAG: hypothetical protein VKP62_11970 [Candidatus Sericytochromatia bacterium]|nr:hypothetical protein [Candidatus Sericytochromatia bacterium]